MAIPSTTLSSHVPGSTHAYKYPCRHKEHYQESYDTCPMTIQPLTPSEIEAPVFFQESTSPRSATQTQHNNSLETVFEQRTEKTTNELMHQMQGLYIRTPAVAGNRVITTESSPNTCTEGIPINCEILTPPTTPSRAKTDEKLPPRRSSNTEIPEYKLDLDSSQKQFLGEGVWSRVYRLNSIQLARESNAEPQTPPSTPQTKTTFKLPRAYAVKIATRRDAAAVFESEARILTHLQRHEESWNYMVPFVGMSKEPSSLVFHCAEEGTLETLTQHTSTLSLSAHLTTFLAIAPQLISGLRFMHKASVIHADIKPANILLDTSASGTLTARFADFSAAFIASENSPPACSAGTWAFMSPEQLSRDVSLSTPTMASDIYALGISLLTFLCGDVPFAALLNNTFRLREAVKIGDPIGFALREPEFVMRLQGLQREYRDRGFKGELLGWVRAALAKKRESRPLASEWLDNVLELGQSNRDTDLGLGIRC